MSLVSVKISDPRSRREVLTHSHDLTIYKAQPPGRNSVTVWGSDNCTRNLEVTLGSCLLLVVQNRAPKRENNRAQFPDQVTAVKAQLISVQASLNGRGEL
jgi:hypothetical protein